MRAAVYLVLDRSGSMRPYYSDGTVQHLAEQVLAPALSAHLDNAGFFPAGRDPRSPSGTDLYDRSLGEFPRWPANARTAGIPRRK